MAAAALFLWASVAIAADPEVSPRVSSGPVVVSAGAEDTIYYALDAGGSLDYAASGPVELVVQTRLRIPPGRTARRGVVEAYGNGEFRIPDIVVEGRAVPDGGVFDARGGVPSEAIVSTIEIPPGGTSLTLRASANGPHFLVRVTKRPAPAVLEIPPVAVAVLVDTPAPVEEPPPPIESPRPDVAVTLAPVEPMLPAGVDVIEAAPFAESRTFLEAHPVHAGVELGLGAPARGTSAVFYYGLQGRIGVVENVLDAALSIGAYRVGVLETHEVADPYTGPVTVEADYHTTVVPVEALGLYRIPVLFLGVVHPYAGAGLSLDVTRRADGDERVGGVAIGTALVAGADVDAGPARVSVSLGWNGVRHDYGNTNGDGDPVRETLATARADVAWLYAF